VGARAFWFAPPPSCFLGVSLCICREAAGSPCYSTRNSELGSQQLPADGVCYVLHTAYGSICGGDVHEQHAAMWPSLAQVPSPRMPQHVPIMYYWPGLAYSCPGCLATSGAWGIICYLRTACCWLPAAEVLHFSACGECVSPFSAFPASGIGLGTKCIAHGSDALGIRLCLCRAQSTKCRPAAHSLHVSAAWETP
jgi:hypothetical protein